MPHERSDLVHLADMLRFAKEVRAFTADRTFQQYQDDIFFRRAVERSVQLIGEAAKRVSRQFEDDHPEIPWNRIIVQRHRIVHEYDRIDDGIIWSVAQKYVPILIEQLEAILPPPPQVPGAEESPAPERDP